MRLRMRVVALVTLIGALVTLGVAGGAALRSDASASAGAQCAPGYELLATKEASERRAGLRESETLLEEVMAGTTCIGSKHPEKLIELILRQEGLETVRSAPYDTVAPGAYANALNQAKSNPKAGKVKGTAGNWELYGRGPLQVDHPDYTSVNGLGLVDNMGRLDSLEYDAATGRLFAAKGTGGIWVSENLGDTWRSIGDGLPSQIVGAVGYTTANGGTVLAISGDGTYGSGGYTGYGAFYSTDVGTTWQKAAGVPDGALGFAIETDPTNPSEVYAATSKGLFRSTDGGQSYVNVKLPTGACAGVEGGGSCQLANMVTDVVVRGAGGVNGQVEPGTVAAVVGWRAGQRKNSDGTVQSPANGVYRSATGAPGSFTKLAATGFALQDRIGRVELGETTGAAQDKDYLYAIVQDAAALNGQLDVVDASGVPDPRGGQGTVLNGIYVSKDFGATWLVMADDNAIAKNPATGSALVGYGQATGSEPGIQAWYNEWVAPDPTRQDGSGVPTRLAFGLEEVWQNEIAAPMSGPTTFKVIGRYFAGETCMFLSLGLPECPTNRPPTVSTTTHPDQQDALWIPDGSGGATLAVGNDGGFYKQHTTAGQEMNNGRWGDGNQTGFATLLPYDVAMANDGTVWAGLQDNGHMKIDSRTREQFETFGGDGTFAEVDPADSDIAYEAYVFNAMKVSTDGGRSWKSIDPKVTGARFVNPFEMDPTDASHLVTAGNEVVETTFGPETTGPFDSDPANNKSWVKVYDLGTASRPGDATATPSPADPGNSMSAIDVIGDATYVGYCGVCDILNQVAPFQSGIATNVGGAAPPKRMSSDGWHIAKAQGLPERFITSVQIDPTDATKKTVYVTLGGYSRRWVPPGTLQDKSTAVGEGHLFRSTDGGETFTDVSGTLPDVPATWVTVRGKQLIVGTDVGVFATGTKGGTTFAYLNGLPVVPISTMNLKPDDPNLLVVATYGRGIWTYCFGEPLPGTTAGCPITPKPLPEMPTPRVGTTLAGPFGFELTAEGWTTTTTDALGVTTFKRGAPGAAGSGTSFQVTPYTDLVTTTLVSPAISHPGGWAFVDFENLRNTEPAFDFLHVEWSSDGQTWNSAPWEWSGDGNKWVPNTGFDGMNHDFPLFSVEKVALKPPAGTLYLRFRFSSDELVSSPAYTGVHVDNVTVNR
ncbi:MAG: hypothetical protein H0U03_03315 [Actinobacteria bacterium]|nr:hypothetical protein [Actinomycetota bacterium]